MGLCLGDEENMGEPQSNMLCLKGGKTGGKAGKKLPTLSLKEKENLVYGRA